MEKLKLNHLVQSLAVLYNFRVAVLVSTCPPAIDELLKVATIGRLIVSKRMPSLPLKVRPIDFKHR